jgi:hypothetical protein
MVVNERAEGFADDFAAANQDVIDFAGSCSDVQWQTIVPGEEWTVGVVIHHIAESHTNGLRWLEAMARGEAVTDTVSDIEERNIAHARRSSGIPIATTIALLRENGQHTEEALRRFSDEELARTALFGPAEGRSLPAEGMAAVLANHAREHLSHARAALQEPS